MVEWNQSLKLFPHRWRSLQERWFLQRASDNEIETASLYRRRDVDLFRRGQEGDGRICTMECKSLLENEALILCHRTYYSFNFVCNVEVQTQTYAVNWTTTWAHWSAELWTCGTSSSPFVLDTRTIHIYCVYCHDEINRIQHSEHLLDLPAPCSIIQWSWCEVNVRNILGKVVRFVRINGNYV